MREDASIETTILYSSEKTLEIERRDAQNEEHLRELRVQQEQFSKRIDLLEWLEEDSALMEQLGLLDLEKVRQLKRRLAKRLEWIQVVRGRVDPTFLQATDVSHA